MKTILSQNIMYLFVGFFLSVSAFAQTNSTAKNWFTCPSIKDLVKDPVKFNWTAPGGWKSYDISFVDKIHVFQGAQWAGANVGQITCLYKGIEQNSFPVLLIFHTLTLEPMSGKWGKDLGGYRNCVSDKQEDCPFQLRLQAQPTDPINQLESIKSNPNELQTPGY